LVVDDEKLLVKGLKRSLEQEGYLVLVSYDGEECLKILEREDVDLILLDLMLPGIDGLELCRIIRKGRDIPIIMLTARGEDVDKIVGLELGADDYITKPFNTRELIARIRAVLRRYSATPGDNRSKVIQVGQLRIDSLRRKVFRGDEKVDLTAREFDLLYLLATHPGRVFNRENLLESVWGSQYYADLRTVDVHIRRLRGKLEDEPGDPEYILTKWGVGYYFREDI
jgi:DNA-binding response OmpR family regulator